MRDAELDPQRLLQRLERERLARKAAEDLLETKAAEFYEGSRMLKAANERLKQAAMRDPLTELPNRRWLLGRLEQETTGAREGSPPFIVHTLDINDLRSINDTLGHAAGDELLQKAAQRLMAIVGKSDTVFRLGGDEFAILQLKSTWPSGAEELARKSLFALSRPFDIFGKPITVSASLGASALLPGKFDDPNSLLTRANIAMQEAKAKGRGTYVLFNDELKQALAERMVSKDQLVLAMKARQFEAWLQPQVSLNGGRCTGFEALARWRHPDRGIVGPNEFIPVLERMGLAVEFGTAIMSAAFASLATFHARGFQDLKIGVNLSAAQLVHGNLVETVQSLLKMHNLKPESVELEITEGSLIVDPDTARHRLDKLRELGVSIALDDFGTGYSSLAYLRQFPIDRIKIDRSFVRELPETPQAIGITRAIVQMARALDMSIVAEGIECDEQSKFLEGEGVEDGQGFLYSRPQSFVDMQPWLEKNRRAA